MSFGMAAMRQLLCCSCAAGPGVSGFRAPEAGRGGGGEDGVRSHGHAHGQGQSRACPFVLLRLRPRQSLSLNSRQQRPPPLSALPNDFPSASFPDPDPSSSAAKRTFQDASNDGTFCIIEGRDTVLDFAPMHLQEIREHINMRRNKIFLLMEEVRRLRIQQRRKTTDQGLKLVDEEANDVPDFPSSIPFLPPLTSKTLKQYYVAYFGIVAAIIIFAGLLAPVLELRMGMGGTNYADFIRNMHLPQQLSVVDPIVASFSGGSVGVISALLVVEINNVKLQEGKRCSYCHGTGYLACARCSATGTLASLEQSSGSGNLNKSSQKPTTAQCPSCAGAAKVMCPTCLCTGMALASEHDPRIDPFSI